MITWACRLLIIGFSAGCLSWAARIIRADLRRRRHEETGRRLAAQARQAVQAAADRAATGDMEAQFSDPAVAWLMRQFELREARRRRTP